MSYQVKMTLSNPTAEPVKVTIPAGSVFEVIDPFSHVQNLMTIDSKSVVIPGRGVQIIDIDSWCLNKSFSPPRSIPMRPTPFRSTRQYSGQNDLWGDLGSRR